MKKKTNLKKIGKPHEDDFFSVFSVETSETLKVKESFDKNKLFLNSNQPFYDSFEAVKRCPIPCFNVANKKLLFKNMYLVRIT